MKLELEIQDLNEKEDRKMNIHTIISWSPMISSITSCNGLLALLGTTAAKTAPANPVCLILERLKTSGYR